MQANQSKNESKFTILNRKFWIFDLDGTLTVPVHDFPTIRLELGIPAGGDILKHIAAQERAVADKMLKKLDAIEVELAEHTKPAEGALELISLLRKNQVRLGIITRNTKKNARRSLKKLNILSCFEDNCILGRSEAPPKPDPQGISQLLSFWNTSPDQAVMVGDYLFDLQTGKAAGTATIHVSPDENAIWPELTDIHISSLQQLIGMFAPQFEN